MPRKPPNAPRLFTLLIASVTLTRRHNLLCVLFAILRQRFSDVGDFVELSLLVAPYKTLITHGID